MHTPVEVTEHALDAYVHMGGIASSPRRRVDHGLGKAIAYRNDAPQIVVPTTYAGSEMTPILGQTEGGLKTTMREPKILPEVVIYDPDLTLGLPVGMSVTQRPQRHGPRGRGALRPGPRPDLLADGARRASGPKEALPRIVGEPRRPCGARRCALRFLALRHVLGTVDMALHHKLCHTLGGSFDLPHAETHAVVLPHAVAYTEEAARISSRRWPGCSGGRRVAGFTISASLGAPLALRDLGLAEADLDGAAELATQNPYWNPAADHASACHPAATGLEAPDQNDAPAHQTEPGLRRRFVHRGSRLKAELTMFSPRRPLPRPSTSRMGHDINPRLRDHGRGSSGTFTRLPRTST